jgi:hypothetical protein
MITGRAARTILLSALIAIAYLSFVTQGNFNLLQASDKLGLTFNSMLLHMLHGRFDVAPSSIGAEAFVRDGRSYAYFGIFPALLRLPLLPFLDLRTTHVERLSCWLAVLVGAGAYVAALVAAFGRVDSKPIRRSMLVPLIFVALLSGPAIMLGSSSLIYNESILWAWAQAMVFVALAVHAMTMGRFSTAILVAMAVMAGLCLLTRVTTGLGLYAALSLIMLHLWLGLDGETGVGLRGMCRRLQQRRIWLPGLVLVAFAAMAAAVNIARWGNPLVFADLHDQLWLIAKYPDRLPRLARYGLFDIRRLGFGIGYYFLPVWGQWFNGWFPLQDRVADLFDALEMPASSFFLTDPLTMLLAGVALWGLLRRKFAGERGQFGGLLLLGLAVPPLLMMMAWYMAFRYRAEFYPFLAAASCLAAASWAERLQVDGSRGLFVVGRVMAYLALLQIGATGIQTLVYRLSIAGPSSGYLGLSLVCADRQLLGSLMAGPLAPEPPRIAQSSVSP